MPREALSYRGFQLEQQPDLSWRVRHGDGEPMHGAGNRSGFTTPPSSLADVKALIDWHLDQAA
jgi:hypothetical protein